MKAILLAVALLLPVQGEPLPTEGDDWDFMCPETGDKCVITREALMALLKERNRLCHLRG